MRSRRRCRQASSAASASTDVTAPTVSITTPVADANVPQSPLTISGTASDVGGVVAGIEVSTDGGATWHPATGRANWTTSGRPTSPARSRSGYARSTTAATCRPRRRRSPSTVAGAACPCSIWPASSPSVAPDIGSEFGRTRHPLPFVQCRCDQRALRFYKHAQNTGTHVGSLWSCNGNVAGAGHLHRRVRFGMADAVAGIARDHRGQHVLRRVVPHRAGASIPARTATSPRKA